jgi:hypothetical protein
MRNYIPGLRAPGTVNFGKVWTSTWSIESVPVTQTGRMVDAYDGAPTMERQAPKPRAENTTNKRTAMPRFKHHPTHHSDHPQRLIPPLSPALATFFIIRFRDSASAALQSLSSRG